MADAPLTPKAAAAILGVTARKVQLMLKAGELEGWRVGRAWRTTALCVRRFQDRHTNHAPGESQPCPTSTSAARRGGAGSRSEDVTTAAAYRRLISGRHAAA